MPLDQGFLPPILFVLFFVFMWVSVVWIIGYLSGWHSLSRLYPHQGEFPEGPRWDGISIPNLTMRNCVSVAVSERGLHFKMMWLFSFGMPPLFIPWEDITASPSKYFFFEMLKLTFRKAPKTPFQLYRKHGDWILGKSQGHLNLSVPTEPES